MIGRTHSDEIFAAWVRGRLLIPTARLQMTAVLVARGRFEFRPLMQAPVGRFLLGEGIQSLLVAVVWRQCYA